MSSAIERLLVEELKLVNKHLAQERVSLRKLLSMDFPYTVLKDGTIHFFRKSELQRLASMLSDEEIDKLELPIIIVMRPDIGEGIGVVEDPIAARVLAKILGIERYQLPLYLYRPQIAELRAQFDTVIQIAIAVRLVDEDVVPGAREWLE